MKIDQIKSFKSFGGFTNIYKHASHITKTNMTFSTIEPRQDINNCIIWLSGLTCTEENFIMKSAAQSYLKQHDTMILCPDTSPRGLDLPYEHDNYDFGSGASFYLNATNEQYSEYYQMYDYIMKEIIPIIKSQFNAKNISIMGHSMGGHGALILALREASTFKAVSAFSPIVNPIQSPWGQKAFRGYLGDDHSKWGQYDATELLKNGYKRDDTILIDQGLSDEFLDKQLKTTHIESIAKEVGQSLQVNYRQGYDHSYYFISSFIENHINFHLKAF